MQVCHYTNEAGELRLSSEYNEEANAVWRSIGGAYNGAEREWVFPPDCADRALEEVKRLFGVADEAVEVQVSSLINAIGDGPFRGWTDGSQVTLGGYVLASRRYKDGRADIKARLVAGRIGMSGGSSKKPKVAPTDDTVFKLEVRRDFAEDNRIPFDEPVAPKVAGRAPARTAPAAAPAAPQGDGESTATFKRGIHLLRIEVPGGSSEATADIVRTLIENMDDEELLRRLRPLITGGV